MVVDAPTRIDSFEALRAQLEAERLNFRVADSERALSLATQLGTEQGIVHLRWEPTPGILQVVHPVPTSLPPSRRDAVALLLHRLNADLAVQGFVLDLERLTITFRTQAFLDASGCVQPGLIGALIGTAGRTVRAHLHDIRVTAGADPQPPARVASEDMMARRS